MKHLAGYIVVFAIGACLLLATKGCVEAFWFLGPRTINKTSEWRTTFHRELEGTFWVPEQASLVYAEKREEFMGGGYLVAFTLPATKKPIEWLELMATKSKFNGCRKSKTKFDCGGDITRLEYVPEKGVFEAEWMWD